MQYNYNIIKNKKFDLCNCWTSLAWEDRSWEKPISWEDASKNI
jgi:hypothetical protein